MNHALSARPHHLVVFFAMAMATSCASSGSVARVARGHIIQGRFVADDAYAAYLRGVVLEAQGRPSEAAAAYEDGLRHDPDSPELWTRLGAVRCAIDAQDRAVRDAFAHAVAIDPTFEEAFTEGARCKLRSGDLEEARRAALRAVTLDPEIVAPVVVLVSILEQQKNQKEAARWLDGLVAREPRSIEAHQAMLSWATRVDDVGRRIAAEVALNQLRPGVATPRPGAVSKPPLDDIDRAVLSSDFRAARSLASRAQFTSGFLALRAAALGRAQFAFSEANVVLSADPTNSDARVAAAVAADLTGNDEGLARALTGLPEDATPLSPLASLLMGELLGRRVGVHAEQAFRLNAGPVGSSDDPLVTRVTTRR